MLDKIKKTAKNTFIYSVGNIAVKASGIIIIPIYGKNLSIEEFGVLALFEVVYQFFQAMAALGTKYSLTRWYWLKEIKGQEKSVAFTTYLFNIFITSINLIISAIVLSYFSNAIFNTEISNRLLLLFLISSFFRILVDFPLLLQRIQHKAFIQILYQLFILVFTISLTVYFISYKKYSLEGVFLSLFISNLLGFLVLLPYLYRNLHFSFKLQILKEMLSFGFPIFISNLVTLFLVLSDRFILNIYGTHENVGQYSLAYRISNLIQMVFVGSFLSAYTHIFFKTAEEQKSGRFFSKSLTYFVLVIVFASVGLVFFSKEIAVILSGGESDYWLSYTIVPLLVLGAIFTGIKGILVLPLAKEKLTKQISIISIFGAILNFGLNFLFIPVLSSQGAALSTAIVQIISVVWLFHEISKRNLVKYEIDKIIKCFILGAIFVGIYYLSVDLSFAIRLILKIILIISYVFLLKIWNFYEQIELERISQAWKKWSDFRRLKQNILNK